MNTGIVVSKLQQNACTLCNGTAITVFIEIPNVPVHCNLLWSTKEDAIQVPRGDIRLGFCQDCGHIFNLAFKPELMDYTQIYENSLHYSSRFQSYAKSLATYLVDRYDLHGKDIIDIGCGKGDFLSLLCELGNNCGVGFDPAYEFQENNLRNSTEQITFIQDFYSERYSNYSADFVCCRHVLEHIQFPNDFLLCIVNSIGNGTKAVVFFEVPNVLFLLKNSGIWDLIYEHCSYFSSISLFHLFTSCGFKVLDIKQRYEDQFLCIEASLDEFSKKFGFSFKDDFKELIDGIATLAEKYRQKVENWRDQLEQLAKIGQRIVVWGAGSKGVAFLNALETYDLIEYVVDINPHKQGKYIAGSGQQIVPPEFLQAYQPELVLIMNSIYKNEISRIMKRLGLIAKFICM